MKPLRLTLRSVILLLLFLPAARALVVFNYTAATHDRWQVGTFPGSPTPNSGFFLSSYDFSGVGWQTASSSFAVTLVSPKNFLAAAHAAPGVGASVSFLGTDNVLRTYTVNSLTTLTHPPTGVASDLVVGTLSAVVDSHINFYPSLWLGGSADAYIGLSLAVYGAGGKVGMNSIAEIGTADFSPTNGIIDNYFAVMNYNSATGTNAGRPAATQGEGGDSSSPSFVLIGGNLAVVGVHSAINSTPPPYQTFDAFVPFYLSGIDSVLQTSGYNMTAYTAVPEPENVALGLGLAAFAWVLRRRRQ